MSTTTEKEKPPKAFKTEPSDSKKQDYLSTLTIHVGNLPNTCRGSKITGKGISSITVKNAT
jgi:hypothetical protein